MNLDCPVCNELGRACDAHESRLQSLVREVVQSQTRKIVWPEKLQNATNGNFYVPQDEIIATYIDKDDPRFLYFASGEGAGKTATGSVKALGKVRRGMSGAVVTTDLPLFRRALWPELRAWIPWSCVVEEHRHMQMETWLPYKTFEITFHNELGGFSKMVCGGLGDNFTKWEGMNLNWVWIDEARSIKDGGAIKVLNGRIRIQGPNGEPEQMFITSTPTPTDHWMYDYFGPAFTDGREDPMEFFKANSKIVKLSLEKNLANLGTNYLEMRGSTLSEAEKQMLIHGEWGAIDSENPFLESVSLWDALYDAELTAPKRKSDPSRNWSDVLVLGIDGATKRDSFAIVAVSRHPKNRSQLAVRLVREFKPVAGKIDFAEIRSYLYDIFRQYQVVTAVYDVHQLYQMMQELNLEGLTWFQEFAQGGKRLVADQHLYDLILQGLIQHMAQPELRQHIQNADAKYDTESRKRRIIKRYDSMKIDLAVELSLAAYECKRLNI